MKVCKVEGCSRRMDSRGFCNNHYRRERKAGRLQKREPQEVFRDDCEVCGRWSMARGRWCWDCYRKRAYERMAS